jgi:ubiquinone/menaquinone biosynthesis C-methylase UbiE
MERQGPGSKEVTLKALSFVDNLKEDSKIVDLGCGTGGQTMTLAQHTPGEITGLDFFPEFIEVFNSNTQKLNFQNRVKGVVGSMDKLPFQKESLDLIWSEGAIYNIGFENGLKYWRDFLKPGAYVAVSEATWFTDERPDEINDFWMREYPGIDTIPNKVAQMQNAGYVPVACFILPENCWIENFYVPHDACREAFLKKYPGNKTANELVENQLNEMHLYYKYKAYYGYVFFIGRKI